MAMSLTRDIEKLRNFLSVLDGMGRMNLPFLTSSGSHTRKTHLLFTHSVPGGKKEATAFLNNFLKLQRSDEFGFLFLDQH